MVIKTKEHKPKVAKKNGHKPSAVEPAKTPLVEDILPPPGSSIYEEPTAEELKEATDILNKLDEVGVDSLTTQQKLGVLQRLVTAVSSDKEYRQVLLTAAFDNKQEALLCADAISECKRYGVSIEPLVDRVISQCSVKSARLDALLRALTHQSFSGNYGGKLPDWKRRQDKRGL